jgi:outer membrane lipoprotein carrier protein
MNKNPAFLIRDHPRKSAARTHNPLIPNKTLRIATRKNTANLPRHTRSGRFARLSVVITLAVWCALAAGNPANLDVLLHSVENRYNHAQSLRLTFTQSYKAVKRADRVESGVLTLRKPGRMRWEYTAPTGKLFVSDGKDVYLYLPDAKRAEHSKFKESEDFRAPLAFLLGKLNFYKEFKSFSLRPEGENQWVEAIPNSDNLPYSKVEFLITPDSQIRRMRVIYQDQSIMDFAFDQEKLNIPLDVKTFSFKAPPGTEVVEGEQ